MERRIKKTDLLFAAVFVLILFVLTFTFRTPRPYSNDDTGIANYLSGSLGNKYASPFIPFINIILGWIMVFLYRLLPGPNWFIIWQIVIEYISICFLQTILMNQLRKNFSNWWSYVLSSVLLAAFIPSFICRIEFTQTAAIGGIMGVFWILFCWKYNSKAGMAIGIIHTTVSFMFRKNGFLICLPFVLIVSIRFCLQHRKEIIHYRKRFSSLILCFGILIAILAAFTGVNTIAWDSGEQKEYKAFNSARAQFKDYPSMPYDEIRQEMEALGVSENDYNLMDGWQFADPEYITTELLTEITAAKKRKTAPADYGKEIKQFFANIVTNNLFRGMDSLLSFCFVLCIWILAVNIRRDGIWAIIVTLCVVSMELFFKVYVGRYPDWVRAGVLFSGASTLVYMTASRPLLKENRILTGSLILLLAFGGAIVGDAVYFKKLGTFSYDKSAFEMYDWMHAQSGKLFFCPTKYSGMPDLMAGYSVFEETEPGIARGTVSLGGWGTNIPARKQAYGDQGIYNPMRQISDDNVYLISSYDMASMLRQYLYEHTGVKASLSLADVRNGALIWKATDCTKRIREDAEVNCKIEELHCEYDSRYNTWNISINIGSEPNIPIENTDRYIKVKNKSGEERLYAVSFCETVEKQEGSALFMIPSGDMTTGIYTVAYYMVANDQTIICSKDGTLEIPAFENGSSI